MMNFDNNNNTNVDGSSTSNNTRFLLPSECTQNILSYLNITDCIHYGTTCTNNLKEILPSLYYRRNRMKLPYGVIKISSTSTQGCNSPTSTAIHRIDETDKTLKESSNSIQFGLVHELVQQYPDNGTVCTIFPTVLTRTEELLSCMPSGHPLIKSLRELITSLHDTSVDDMISNIHSTSLSTTTELLIQLLQKSCKPMKLHEYILINALAIIPTNQQQQRNSNNNNNNNSNSTLLGQYIGDVLCVTYLLQDCNTNCSYAEGSRCYDGYFYQNSSLYRSWVLTHSSILRTKTFTNEQRKYLGIPSNFTSSSNYIDDDDIPIIDTSITDAIELYYRTMYTNMIIPFDSICQNNNTFMNSTMTLIYDEFGRLGPASFRGRDIVRVQDISAHCLISYLSSPQQHISGHPALEWIFLTHIQAFKSRPMTVREPIIRFSYHERG